MLDQDAKVLRFHRLRRAAAHGLLEAGNVAGENVVHLEARGGVEQRIVHGILDGVGGVDEGENVSNGLLDAVGQGGLRVNDILVSRQGVAIHDGIERAARGWFNAGQHLLRRHRVPAHRRGNLLQSGDRDSNMLVNRIRERPVKPRPQQGFFPFADRLAKPQNYRPLLRPDREKA